MLAAAALSFGAVSLAFGQAPPEPGDKCRAQPPAATTDQLQTGNSEDESLTDALADCKGVLKPPAVGDGEIAEPPPAVGETPVIRPGDVPPQPPGDGG